MPPAGPQMPKSDKILSLLDRLPRSAPGWSAPRPHVLARFNTGLSQLASCLAYGWLHCLAHLRWEKLSVKTHARVVVIGGGVVGVSTLYHLALKGWSDLVLLERAELTAGSTWHAAGLLPLFNMSYTVGQLHKYSVDL